MVLWTQQKVKALFHLHVGKPQKSGALRAAYIRPQSA